MINSIVKICDNTKKQWILLKYAFIMLYYIPLFLYTGDLSMVFLWEK